MAYEFNHKNSAKMVIALVNTMTMGAPYKQAAKMYKDARENGGDMWVCDEEIIKELAKIPGCVMLGIHEDKKIGEDKAREYLIRARTIAQCSPCLTKLYREIGDCNIAPIDQPFGENWTLNAYAARVLANYKKGE